MNDLTPRERELAILGAAKIRIHRARLRLKQALSEQCEFYRDADSVFRCDRKP